MYDGTEPTVTRGRVTIGAESSKAAEQKIRDDFNSCLILSKFHVELILEEEEA